jgi:lysophospholipase L1-like esterase
LLTLDSSSATGTILRISNSSTGGHVFDLLSTGSSNTNGAGRLDIFDSTAGQARLSIAANGNVGIGTTSPFAAFAVVGNAFLSGNLSVGDATTTRSNLGLPYASSAYIATLSSPIAAWGDSLTQGTFTTVNTPYPTQLSQISGYVVFNGGVGAQTSAQIATRMLLAGDKYTWPTIIWAGRNDISGTLSTDEPIIDANIALMVSALQSVGNNNYIVMSILNGEGEGTGTNNYNEIIQINSDLATIYGSHYVDVRSYLVQNGLGVAGITPSAQDLTDISNDVPPTDLRYDWLHPNTAGYGVVAQDVYANMNLLNSLFNTQSVVTVNDLRQSLGDFSSGLYIGGIRALYANSANSVTLVGVGAGFSLSTTTLFNTAVGYQSLYYATSSSYNTAVGPYSLYGDTTGSQNTAIGYTALYGDTTGGSNVAIGHNAMHSNTTGGSSVAAGWGALQGNSTGNSDIALGYSAMYANLTGSNNVAIGQSALYNNKSATSTIAIGYGTAQGGAVYNNQGGVYVGFEAGFSAASSSNYNTFLGYQAGFDISTGTNNIILGPEASTGGNHLTTGTNNIGIGYNLVFPGGTAAKNQLNIGNFIFGTGLTTAQSGTSIPATLTGSLAFGTSTPYSTLEVWGPNAASTSAFAVVNSASTTEFTVYDTGNATLAGSLVQNSDQRLKTNIQDLDGSSSLAEIEALNPVTFNWIDPAKSSLPQLGFIAQQAQSVFPNLVSTTSPTALTPDGTLSLNYIDLISPIVAAIQELDKEITSLASTVAGFAQSITTTLLSAQEADVQKLCVGSTCVTPAQFQAMVAAANQSASASASPASLILVATDTPPVIAINGDNPAIVQVGASYSDLGATITGPQADLNLGIKTFLNGLFVRNIQLDTSAAATDTIDYVVTDQNGLTSSSTRTIIVLPAADPSTTAPPASSAATSSTSATPSTPT